MKSLLKYTLLIFLVLLVVSSLIAGLSAERGGKKEEISLSKLITEINEGLVKTLVVQGGIFTVELREGTVTQTVKAEPNAAPSETLKNLGADETQLKKIEITIKEEGFFGYLPSIIQIVLPFLFIGLLFWFMFRSAQKGAMGALNFGKSKARLAGTDATKKKVTFKDVAGLIEAKEEVVEIVEFLRDPTRFKRLGARMPRGFLLVGTPGTGKTLLAKAVANEANVPFYFVSGSEFVEMFVGVGASVTGDTPVLVRENGRTSLIPIGKLIDRVYDEHNKYAERKGTAIPVRDLETLGFDSGETGFRGLKKQPSAKQHFANASWKNVRAVYRHRVNEIYTIEYLGGTLRTTGDHSVFVRTHNYIAPKKVSELIPGDILVNLPYKVRGAFVPGIGTTHQVRAFHFQELEEHDRTVELWSQNEILREQYQFALLQRSMMSQQHIAQTIGASQMSVSEWQRGVSYPQELSLKVHTTRNNVPSSIVITPDIMRLVGYYLAEGRTTRHYTQFVFGAHESKLHEDCAALIKSTFNIEPHLEPTEDNSMRITFSSVDVAKFFENMCGTGSHEKHLPEIVWRLPYAYFAELLKGFSRGDGYTTQEGKLSMTSVSKQLITELAWLCSMHGLKVGIREGLTEPGRLIKQRPVVSSGAYWNLIIGKSSHPFIPYAGTEKQFKKPVVRSVTKSSYDGFVYDFCGCDNEAFFGGQTPLLLHNTRVRDTFEAAKKNSPAIIFIDEIDAVGRHRGAGMGGGHDEREQTLNQILVEMDGFDTDTAVIVMAATNRPDILDPALLRPGRFDRRIILDEPSLKDREAILRIHAGEKPLGRDVNLRVVAERTPGFSGADLANLINEGAILAARKNQTQIMQTDILQAVEKVMLGPERKSKVLSPKEKEITAYHEAGHALVAVSVPHSDPVHKVSIVSRGRAGGYTLKLPSEDRMLKTKSEFEAELAVLMGGYMAEQIVFKELTTGASNDLKVASDLARRMVTEFGMSEKIGPSVFGEKDEMVFMGRDFGHQKNYSNEVAYLIDTEVKALLSNALKKAKDVITKKIEVLNRIAKELIAKETLEQKELYALIG